MDEQNNGPVPGIIGQDIPSEPTVETSAPVAEAPKDDGKVFDSSAFTGVKQESITFNANGEEKTAEPKGPSIFTKWQTWAITSGVILVAAVAAVFITVMIYEGKLSSSNAIARYDSLSDSLNVNKAAFEEKLTEYTKTVYGSSVSDLAVSPASDYNTDPEKYIYPTENDIHVAGNDCLKQGMFGLTDDDIAYVEVRKSSYDLQKEGKDVAKEAERLEKINNAYRSAAETINNCFEPLINVKLKDFKIEIEEASFTRRTESRYADYLDVRRKIKVTYNGDKELTRFKLIYGLQDKNGLNAAFLFANYVDTENHIKKGDVMEFRLCGSASYLQTSDKCVYTVSLDGYEEAEKDKSYEEKIKQYKAQKPVIQAISGEYYVPLKRLF